MVVLPKLSVLYSAIRVHELERFLQAYFSQFTTILSFALPIVLGVLLMRDLRSYAAAILSALIAVTDLAVILQYHGAWDLYMLLRAAYILGWLGLALLLLPSDPSDDRKHTARKLYFLPALLVAAYLIPRWIHTWFPDLSRLPLRFFLRLFLPVLLEIAGVYLAGRWAAEQSQKDGSSALYPETRSAGLGYERSGDYALDWNARAESQLLNYKQLLDAGIMTKEEYEKKKRELRG